MVVRARYAPPGLALTLMLIVISLMVRKRTCGTIQSEIPSRDAIMGSVIFGFAAVCGPACANYDEFGTAQRPKYSFAATKRCNYYTPSKPSYGLKFDGKVNCVICSVSQSCSLRTSFINLHLSQVDGQWSNYRTW